MSNHPKADFDRTCDKCKHFSAGRFARCNAPRNLITGQPLPVDVHAARSPRGHCGPSGKRFDAIEVAEPVPPMTHTNINAGTAVAERVERRRARRRTNGAAVAGLLALAILAAWTPPAAAEHAPTYRSRYVERGYYPERRRHHVEYRRHKHAEPVYYSEPQCHRELTREGDQYASEDGAKDQAVKAWQQAARWKYGERFMSIENAVATRYECGRSSVGSVVGQVFYRCSIEAVPCRPNLK